MCSKQQRMGRDRLLRQPEELMQGNLLAIITHRKAQLQGLHHSACNTTVEQGIRTHAWDRCALKQERLRQRCTCYGERESVEHGLHVGAVPHHQRLCRDGSLRGPALGQPANSGPSRHIP